MKHIKNYPASIRQRLMSRAENDRRPFNELLQYYAMERFLYRLSLSAHQERFILKGALLLRAWRSPEIRPTMDIDLLGRIANYEEDIIRCVQDIMAVKVDEDGLVFDPGSIRAERITEGADYEGLRVRFPGMHGTARISMQLDIGFGDEVYPGPEVTELPNLLDGPPPRLLCYSRESAIAEKFEAMVKLGPINSRMKDFYDIRLLSRQYDFNGADLAEAIRRTLKRRGTLLPIGIEAFNDPFLEAKQAQWMAFRNRLGQDHLPVSFKEIGIDVREFLSPIASALSSGQAFAGQWIAPGPWKVN